MADGPRKLPKWQASANGMPNHSTANLVPKNIFSCRFFLFAFQVWGGKLPI